MKTKYWIVALAAALLACGILSLVLLNPQQAETAQILSDGKLLRTVNLQIDQEFTVEYKGEANTVTVQGGKIAVTAASCRNVGTPVISAALNSSSRSMT